MNELDLIRTFRADMPAPNADETARADRAWRRARSPRWQLAPVPYVSRLAAAGALAAAAVAAAVVLPGGDESRLAPAKAAAAETLTRAAAVQEGELSRPLRAGEFWYVRTQSATTIGGDEHGGYTAIQPELREEWVARDGTRRWVVRPTGPLRFPGPRDRARWEAAGSPAVTAGAPEEHRAPAPRRGPFYLGDAAVSYADLLALPRDAQALYQRLRQAAVDCDCGHNVDSETFVIVGDTLRSTPIPDDLRAAFLRAAALIPGIRLVAQERDVTGRPAVGVAYDYAGRRDELLFDRDSFTRLGENDRRLTRADYADARPGQLVGGWAYVDSGIVTSQFARP
jgi:hypothetical protein